MENTVNDDDRAHHYVNGYCDVFALALHKITGLPLGMWAQPYTDYYSSDEGEEVWEHAHAVVIVDDKAGHYLDVYGLGEEVPDNLYFNNQQNRPPALITVDYETVNYAFTSQGADKDPDELQAAIDFALTYPPVRDALANLSKEDINTTMEQYLERAAAQSPQNTPTLS